MDNSTQELAQQTRGAKDDDTRSNRKDNIHLMPKLKHYKKWLRIITYILFLLVGQTTAILLGRLYFDKGGNSKWMATFVQTAGFPILIPLTFFFPSSPPTGLRPPVYKLTLLYSIYGLFVAADNLMYSYGLQYLPVSTYSLLCASQLAFNAVTSFFINAQKFTALVLNSIVILTISACLIATNAGNDASAGSNVAPGKFALGFICAVGASATLALLVSVAQYSFEKVFKDNSFNTVVCMQLYPYAVATCVCVIGLFGSGEWRTLKEEMRDYKGRVPYVMVLVSTAISWQLSALGLFGLIFEVSSLFSNVIATLSLPLVPILAVVFFHDKMNGVKVIALILAMWGFLSYIYQHYLDNVEATAKKAKKGNGNEIIGASTEMC